MPLTSFLMGSAGGVAVQLYSNSVRRMPALTNPHLHVVWGLLGGFGALKLQSTVEEQVKETEELHRTLGRTQLPK